MILNPLLYSFAQVVYQEEKRSCLSLFLTRTVGAASLDLRGSSNETESVDRGSRLWKEGDGDRGTTPGPRVRLRVPRSLWLPVSLTIR